MLIRTPRRQHFLQFFASSQHICFHGAKRDVENARGLIVGETVLTAQNDGAPLVDGKQFESACEIMSESGIDGLGIVFGFQLSFVDANEFLSFPRFFPETIVGDPVKPGRKTRFAAKTPKVFVSAEKRFLREIVGQGDIAPDQIAKQTSDSRLVIPNQLRKGVVVVVNKNACNEVCISQGHPPMLGQWRRFVCVFRPFQFPNQEISHPDQERNNAERPGAAFPLVNRAEEDHETESDHDQNNAAAHIRPRPDRWGWREKRRWHGLTFLHHLSDGTMERAAAEIAEEHDRSDDQDRRAEQGGEDDPNDRDRHERAVFHIEVIAIMAAPGHRHARRSVDAEMALQFF